MFTFSAPHWGYVFTSRENEGYSKPIVFANLFSVRYVGIQGLVLCLVGVPWTVLCMAVTNKAREEIRQSLPHYFPSQDELSNSSKDDESPRLEFGHVKEFFSPPLPRVNNSPEN